MPRNTLETTTTPVGLVLPSVDHTELPPDSINCLFVKTTMVPGGVEFFVKSHTIGTFFENLNGGSANATNSALGSDFLGRNNIEGIYKRRYWIINTDSRTPSYMKVTPNEAFLYEPDKATFLLFDTELKKGYTLKIEGKMIPRDAVIAIAEKLKGVAAQLYQQYVAPLEVVVNLTITGT